MPTDDHTPPVPRAPRFIESPQNPLFRTWESLLESRGLKKQGQFILSGLKTVPEALVERPEWFSILLVRNYDQIADWTLPQGLQVVELATPLFRALDIAGTGFPLLIGKVPDMPRADLSQPPQGLELICALGDPNNLGALLRSAVAFGVQRVILLEGAAHPYHPKCLRAAANAVFSIPILRGGRWQDVASAAGPLVALDGGGEDLSRYRWPDDVRVVLGEEGPGIPADLRVRRLSIPTTGLVESLNATVAASVVLFAHHTRQR